MRTRHRVVILGGGYAGLMAASRAARAGSRVEITLVDARPSFTQRIRSHELLVGRPPRSMAYQPLLQRRGVRFLQAWVEGLNPAGQSVMLALPECGRSQLSYDTLIIALGSSTGAPLPGVAKHMLRLNDPARIEAAQPRLQELAATQGRVLIVGGGLTGIEVATELADSMPGLRVTLASGSALGRGWSAGATQHFYTVLERMGVELIEDAKVEGVDRGQAWLADGSALAFDLGIWAGGFAAAPLGRIAGLPVLSDGRILVDEHLRTPNFPNILVAGDSAAALGGRLRMSCAAALPLGASAGAYVAATLRGRQPQPLRFGYAVRCVSLGRRDGLLQYVAPDDTPLERVWTGSRGAMMKELICSFAYAAPYTELWSGLRWYRWPHGLTDQLGQQEPAGTGVSNF